jgi:uncharacterized membrane protein YdjX (TVP38/TMEM64 family)
VDNKTSGERRISRSDILGIVGLLAFFVAVGIACYLAWPFIQEAYEDGGVQGIITRIHSLGHWGVFALLAMQVLQIVIAFIPGELVQVAAGLLYGPWWGTLIILVGCVLSSALIFVLVRKLGAPFVRDMVGEEHLESFRRFEATGKLDWIVFILFLIPGLPKDTFAYLVPLTDMSMGRFLLLSTVGRIPGVFVSTFAAHDIANGNYLRAGIIFGIGALIALVGVLNRNQLIAAVEKFHHLLPSLGNK